MGCNICYNGKTAKIDSNITNIRDFMGVLRYQCTVFIIFFIFRSIIRINIRIGGNKIYRFSILFYFNLPNNNVGGSVNQSIIKKGLMGGLFLWLSLAVFT